MILSMEIFRAGLTTMGDPSRIASQVVVGVGFIGRIKNLSAGLGFDGRMQIDIANGRVVTESLDCFFVLACPGL